MSSLSTKESLLYDFPKNHLFITRGTELRQVVKIERLCMMRKIVFS